MFFWNFNKLLPALHEVPDDSTLHGTTISMFIQIHYLWLFYTFQQWLTCTVDTNAFSYPDYINSGQSKTQKVKSVILQTKENLFGIVRMLLIKIPLISIFEVLIVMVGHTYCGLLGYDTLQSGRWSSDSKYQNVGFHLWDHTMPQFRSQLD
jgi:hypothetical protein